MLHEQLVAPDITLSFYMMDLYNDLSVDDILAKNITRAGFVSEPDGRGTLSLLFSCLFTLVLCVWSAIHLNLPKHGETSFEYTWRYLKWSLLGIFGPELVVWVAWRQYISARALRNDIVSAASCRRESAESQNASWSLTHGFYAGMGGFVFDLSDLDDTEGQSFTSKSPRLHITSRGVKLLSECGLLPQITEVEIQDKSKSDGTEKLICILQTTWMLFQVGARLILDLPVTMLELNTIAHVFCALVIFVMWWNKPRWVTQPTKLKGEWTRRMCAFMYMSSHVSGRDETDRVFLRDFGVKSEISELYYDSSSSTTLPPAAIRLNSTQQTIFTKNESSSGRLVATNTEYQTPLVPGQFLKRPAAAPTEHEISSPGRTDGNIRHLRWALALEAIHHYPAIKKRLLPHEPDSAKAEYQEALRLYPEMPKSAAKVFKRRGQPQRLEDTTLPFEFKSEELVVDHPRNWPADDLLRGVPGLFMGTTLWLVSMCFGAVHLAGWHASFPSEIEAWLWRMSAVFIVFSGFVWTVIHILAHVSGGLWCYWYDLLSGKVHWISYVILLPICTVCGILYLAARMYIVVEAFTSLRSLPIGAFVVPSWLIAVPHF